MKVEGWLFLGCGVFFAGADIVYWYVSYDPTGTDGARAGGRPGLLTGFYLLFTGRRLPVRPEDDERGRDRPGHRRDRLLQPAQLVAALGRPCPPR